MIIDLIEDDNGELLFTIPDDILQELHWKIRDTLKWSVDNDSLILSKIDGDGMTNPFEQVRRFMVAGDQCVNGTDSKQADLYLDLIREESQEFWDGVEKNDDIETIDGLVDTLWVLAGYAHSRGWDIIGAFNEVARSNMSKVDLETGKLIKREDGKVLKPAHYSPPDLKSFI